MGGEDGYFTVFAMGPPSDFEVQKGESLETSEQVMERYLCWVELFLQIAFMQAFDIHATRMHLVTSVYTHIYSKKSLVQHAHQHRCYKGVWHLSKKDL